MTQPRFETGDGDSWLNRLVAVAEGRLVISLAVFENENCEKLHISPIFLILEHTYDLPKRCC